jgi:hypothetical protein
MKDTEDQALAPAEPGTLGAISPVVSLESSQDDDVDDQAVVAAKDKRAEAARKEAKAAKKEAR